MMRINRGNPHNPPYGPLSASPYAFIISGVADAHFLMPDKMMTHTIPTIIQPQPLLSFFINVLLLFVFFYPSFCSFISLFFWGENIVSEICFVWGRRSVNRLHERPFHSLLLFSSEQETKKKQTNRKAAIIL